MTIRIPLCPQCREIAAVADAPCADCVTVDRLAAAFEAEAFAVRCAMAAAAVRSVVG